MKMEKIKNNLSKIIIALLAVVLVVLGVSFYNFTISSETKHVESENLRILKLEEENNLRSELDDIIEQYDNSREELDNLNVDLDEKQSEINNLKSEIRNLLNVKHDLKQAKEKILSLQNISKKYFAQVDSLLGKTEELQLKNTNLIAENLNIKTKNKDLNSENTELNTRLDIGSTLEVYDVEIDKLKYSSHGQERNVIWAKNIQLLRCCFKISANAIAKTENKKVYIQFFSPTNELLRSSSSPIESVFVVDNLEIVTTTYTEFNYNNEEIELCIDWERGDVLVSGKYKVVFFIEGKKVGSSSFKLN